MGDVEVGALRHDGGERPDEGESLNGGAVAESNVSGVGFSALAAEYVGTESTVRPEVLYKPSEMA